MIKRLLRPALLILPAFVLSFNTIHLQAQEVSFRFMFYNTENFFDTLDDPLTGDNDFLPGGVMRWNNSRYLKKLNSIYKTIIAAGEWHPPDVIALCEVENRKVLEDLIRMTNLSKLDYDIVHADSPDERGIDVAMLYRKEIAGIISYAFRMPSINGEKVSGTRYLLHAAFRLGNDTVQVFVNHWPSRRGGVLAGEDVRLAMSDLLRAEIDSLSERSHGGAKIIIAGDFNCTPFDTAVTSLTGKGVCRLVNPALKLAEKGSGTYRFKGAWEMIDQVIISEYLLNCSKGLFANGSSFRVFRGDFLLRNDPSFPGLSPYSTYRGYRYQGGFSDHLPVLLDLFLR